MGRVDCQMVYVSAPPILTAQHCADDGRSYKCDPTQSAVLFQKSPDCFPIVAFGNIQSFDFLPDLHRRIVIVDRVCTSLLMFAADFSTIDVQFCGFFCGGSCFSCNELFRCLLAFLRGRQPLCFSTPRGALSHIISSAIVSHFKEVES